MFENFKTLQSLIEFSFDFIFLLETSSGKIVSANQKACDALGYSHSELLFLTFNDLYIDEAPRLDDLFKPIHGFEAIDLKPSNFKLKCGDVFPVELVANAFEENGVAYVVVCVRKVLEEKNIESIIEELKSKGRELAYARTKAELAFETVDQMVEDRTQKLKEVNEQLKNEVIERKEAEKQSHQFSNILDNLVDETYVIYASSLKFKQVNLGARKNLAYSMEELLDLTPYDLTPQFTKEQFEEQIEPLRKFEKDQIIFQTNHQRKDGSLYPIEIRLQLMNNEKPPVFVAIIQDITERKRNEEKIFAAMKEAEKSSQAKSDFLSRMSHELRTPMNSILGFSQLLGMDPKNPLVDTQRKSLDEILSAGKHLLELINEVLDLSVLETGAVELDIKTVDLVPIVENVVSICKTLADQNQLSILFKGNETNRYFIDADQHRLKQIVFNLMSNAIKYNKPNGSIEVSFEKQGNDKIRLGIRDTGHGIPEEMKEKLFRPFERFDADSEKIEGTGIGLTITKHLVEMMNGTIGLESKYGEGSYFYFDMPLSEKIPTVSSSEGEPHSTKCAAEEGNNKTILYIEDSLANVNLVKNILAHRQQVKLISVSNALDGIELATIQIPDLILMDINLPGMNGLEAFEILQRKKETQHIPVIALSADAMDAQIKKAMDMNFFDYITKPINVQNFLKIIDTVLSTIKV